MFGLVTTKLTTGNCTNILLHLYKSFFQLSESLLLMEIVSILVHIFFSATYCFFLVSNWKQKYISFGHLVLPYIPLYSSLILTYIPIFNDIINVLRYRHCSYIKECRHSRTKRVNILMIGGQISVVVKAIKAITTLLNETT